MKIFSFIINILSAIVITVSIYSCKVKKQTTIDDKINAKSISQLSAQKQQSANIVQQTKDSSKTVKTDSAFVSVVEKDDIEYDYPNPSVGSPSKIIRHIEKITNFQNGENTIEQKNVKSIVTTDIKKSEEKKDTQVSKSKENQHSNFSITSSSTLWVWLIGLVILLAAVGIYLIKRFNLISLISSSVSKIV